MKEKSMPDPIQSTEGKLGLSKEVSKLLGQTVAKTKILGLVSL